MNKQFKGSLILLLTAFLWGLAFVAQSVASSNNMHPFTVLYSRSFVAVIVLFPFFLVSRKKEGKREVKKRDLILGPILCGLCLCLGSLFQQTGMETTSAGKSGFLTSMYIILVPIFSLFLKRKCGINVYISLPIAVIGLLLLSFDFSGGLSFNTGDLLILIGTIFFALQIIFIDYYSKVLNTFYLSIGQLSTQGILMLIARIISCSTQGSFTNPFNNIHSILAILFLGIFSSAIAYTLQLVGQKDVNPTVSSLILSLESVFSAISSVIIYQFYKFSEIDQNMSLTEILGALILFLAVCFSQLPSSLFRKKPKYYKDITNKIDELIKDKDLVIVAIDGNSGSGKTTIANYLCTKYKDINIIHIDDFYNMNKGEISLDSVDGNINYEYLKENVIDKLNEDEFKYLTFDPHKEKTKENGYKKKKIVAIEGSYSLHPSLGKYYDLSIFLKLDKDTQNKRLIKRNGGDVTSFINKWVKLEDNYISNYKIEEKADILIEIKE